MKKTVALLLFAIMALTPMHGQTSPTPAEPTASEKELVAQAHRLVLLSLQLQEEVEKTRRFELSVKVVQESDQIERLARTMRLKVQPAQGTH